MNRTRFSLLPGPLVACFAGALLFAWGSTSIAAADDIVIKALSNRADLISGGDVLVEVLLPAGDDSSALDVYIDGRDVTSNFEVRSDGRLYGLIDGLEEGISRVTATLRDGRGAYLYISNHPIGGPVFSGPQIQSWTCNPGAEDEQCNRAANYSFSYMSTDGVSLGPYDPENPPNDVAMTTTDHGETVQFIIRTETGTIVRDQYKIAVLYDPDQPWEPTDPQLQWNRKLVITHGASCDITFEAGNAPDVTNSEALGRGFAVMSHALDNSGHNCDPVTQAEALIATKEYLVDNYGGPIRYTIGTGCSGGALAQQHIANSYPGVYQGITPACSFTDSWSSTMQYQDYVLSRRYYEDPTLWAPGVVWSPHQIAAVNGHPNPSNPVTFTTVIAPSRDPSRSCSGLDADQVYHHDDNPLGIRCSIMDHMVNRVGRRTLDAWTPNEVLREEGHGRSTYDNVGIQYGLRGLLDGTLLPSQFVDVNVKFGAKNIDYEQQGSRRAADPRSIELAMRTGAVNVGNNMADVAIIDLRGPDEGAFHDVYRTYAMRERLMREQGHVDNQMLWRGPITLLADVTFTDASIVAMDEWLAAIEADERDIPLAEKVREDRPASVDNRCTNGEGTDVPAAQCDAVVKSYSTPRFEAGMPLSDDILKCDLKPLNRDEYVTNVGGIEVPVLFSDAQWSAFEAAFPTGVCDYTQPGQEWTETVPWLDYTEVEGGEPMGPAPVSVPFRGSPPPPIGECMSDPYAPGCPTEGRVYGTGYWSSTFDKVKFKFDAKYKRGGLKGKLKINDKEAGVKIKAKTITSLTSGAGKDCNGVVLGWWDSFEFTVRGSFESSSGTIEGAEFRACGVDNGKGSSAPPDIFYVESLTPSIDYNTGAREVEKGKVHLHDPIQ
jgi:hypothetical protein